MPIDEPFRLSRVLGVVLIKGGNHKLAVELLPPNTATSQEAVRADIQTFMEVYAETHKGVSASRIKYLALDEFDF